MTANSAYTVYIKSGAEKQIKSLTMDLQKKITEAILSLAENPRPHGVKKLSASDNLYRVRVGAYRILYSIQDQKLIVEVIRVGARKDVYRNI